MMSSNMLNALDRIPTFEDFMQIPLFLFDTVGLFVFRFDKQRHRYSWSDRLHMTLLLLQISWNISCMAAFFVYGKLESAIDITTLVLYWTFALGSSLKGAWMYYKRHNIRVLFWLLAADFPATVQERNLFHLDEYYLKLKKYNKYLTIFHMVTTSMFNIFPLVQSLGEYLYAPEYGLPCYLPYMMSYPFDERKMLGFIIAYVLQCLGAYTCSCFFLGTDLLTLTLVHTMNMHLDYLKRQIVAFTPTGTDEDVQTLNQLLIFHQKLYAYSNKIDSVLSVSNLANYFACIIMICLIAIQIVLGNELWNLLKFLCFLIATLVQVFFISVFATTMLNLSCGIGDAFFEQRWYLANLKYQRMLKFPISRAQRPIALTALKFFVISMESFQTLMSTSYQFFTLIKTRLDENI